MEESKNIENRQLTKAYMLELGYNDIEITKVVNHYALQEYSDIGLRDKISKIYVYLSELGLRCHEIIKITSSYPNIYGYRIEMLKEKIDILLCIGINLNGLKKMLKEFPNVLGFSKEVIPKKVKNMTKLGYSDEEVIKMIKNQPNLMGYSKKTLEKKIDNLVTLGYTRNNVIKMCKRNPDLLCKNTKAIGEKIERIMALGYERMEVIKMTSQYPPLLSMSIDSISKKQNILLSFGYSNEDVKKIVLVFPPIYGFSIETLTEKLEFYSTINLLQIFILEPKNLMQSVELSYARYMFYKENNVEFTHSNWRILFMVENTFVQKYGISKLNLLELYKYDEYKKNAKVRALT